MSRAPWLLGVAGLLVWVGWAGCLLSVDYDKVEAAGSGGAGTGGSSSGMGGSGAMNDACPPWPDAPQNGCTLTRDEIDNCCFAGRDCGPSSLTTCFNGECAAYEVSQPSSTGDQGRGLAITSTHVVWGWAGPNGAGPGTIMRRPLGETTVETIDTRPAWRPTFMATDGSQVFWLNHHSNELWALSPDGQTRVVARAGDTVTAGFGRLLVEGNFVYFAMESESNGGSSGIWRANTDATDALAVMISDAVTPIGMAIDPAYIYFSEREPMSPSTMGRLMRLDRDLNRMPEVLLADAGTHPGEIAVDNDHLYWVTEDDELNRIQLGITMPTPTVMQSGQGGISNILIDDQYIYWNILDFVSGEGVARKMSIYDDPGSLVSDLTMTMGAAPSQLAQTCDTLFWVTVEGSTLRAVK